MSTKELIEEANKLLDSTWEESEKVLVKKMLDTMISYKSLIPKFLKADIKALLIMANRIKGDYDDLVMKYNELLMKDNEFHDENNKSVKLDLEKEQLEINKLYDEIEEKITSDINELP
jgi:hypothetical protein